MLKKKQTKRLTKLERLSAQLHAEIIDLKKTTATSTANIDRILKQTSESIDRVTKETSQSIDKVTKETSQSIDRAIKETSQTIDRVSKETSENIGRVEKQWGNVASNLGDVAEDFFYNGLEFRKKLGDIKFDDIFRNVDDINHKEYDIVLKNGKTIGLIEVKHKLHPNDVAHFINDTMPAFKSAYTLAQRLDVVGAVAGLAVPKDAKDLAEKHGLFVLTQSGKNLRTANSKGFTPKRY